MGLRILFYFYLDEFEVNLVRTVFKTLINSTDYGAILILEVPVINMNMYHLELILFDC